MNSNAAPQVIVAGHLCLDLIPTFAARSGSLRDLLAPGKLVEVGPVLLAPGGAVANTGLALPQLGVATALVGKIGADALGRNLAAIFQERAPALAGSLIVAEGVPTSYSLVISPPGMDRLFLHCPGANDSYSADEITDAQLAGARLLHFGYPPLMRQVYADEGRALARLFARAHALGLVTALDMAQPDPTQPAGRVDWRAFLARVLPEVDLFLPSLDEIVFMLDRARFGTAPAAGGELLDDLARQLLDAGATLVGLKLGDQGLYLRTTAEAGRFAHWGAAAADRWCNRELLTPCLQVNVAGTTGAGDSTVAGFIAGWLLGLSPEAVLRSAVAVGACCVEQPDATSGVPHWSNVQQRLRAGWPRRPTALALAGWRLDPEQEMWSSPRDAYSVGRSPHSKERDRHDVSDRH